MIFYTNTRKDPGTQPIVCFQEQKDVCIRESKSPGLSKLSLPRDLSKGGALIRCHDLPMTDETFELKIEIPGHLLKVSATVEKVRLTIDEGDCTSGSFDLAVRFLEVNLEQRKILYNAIEHQSQKDGELKLAGTSSSLGSIPPNPPLLPGRTDRPSKNSAPPDSGF